MSLEPPVSDQQPMPAPLSFGSDGVDTEPSPPPTSSRLCFWLSGLIQIASRKTGRVAPGPGPGPANHGYSYCTAYWFPGPRCDAAVRKRSPGDGVLFGLITVILTDTQTHTHTMQRKT